MMSLTCAYKLKTKICTPQNITWIRQPGGCIIHLVVCLSQVSTIHRLETHPRNLKVSKVCSRDYKQQFQGIQGFRLPELATRHSGTEVIPSTSQSFGLPYLFSSLHICLILLLQLSSSDSHFTQGSIWVIQP